MGVSQLYTYGNFEYYRRGDFRILKGGTPIEAFYSLSRDIDCLNLAAYLCELAVELTDEGEPAQEMLRLTLNSLHAAGRGLYPLEQIKGAFELRAAVLSGYAPDLSGCSVCGKSGNGPFYLDVMNGALICPECLAGSGKGVPAGAYAEELREAEIRAFLPEPVLAAMRYCVSAPINRLFSFSLTDGDDLALFSRRAETYLLSHLGRGFDTLNFYHSLRDPQTSQKKEQ